MQTSATYRPGIRRNGVKIESYGRQQDHECWTGERLKQHCVNTRRLSDKINLFVCVVYSLHENSVSDHKEDVS